MAMAIHRPARVAERDTPRSARAERRRPAAVFLDRTDARFLPRGRRRFKHVVYDAIGSEGAKSPLGRRTE